MRHIVNLYPSIERTLNRQKGVIALHKTTIEELKKEEHTAVKIMITS